MGWFKVIIFYCGIILLASLICMALDFLLIKLSDKYREWFFKRFNDKNFFYYVVLVVYFPMVIFQFLLNLFAIEKQKWDVEQGEKWVELSDYKIAKLNSGKK
ncbi:hypothetical protein JW865_08205 [Candidatus Bathyarchaeota archaeon]|nr:hypothetical protein [Candidatus Bathyarchaeota archaeon]